MTQCLFPFSAEAVRNLLTVSAAPLGMSSLKFQHDLQLVTAYIAFFLLTEQFIPELSQWQHCIVEAIYILNDVILLQNIILPLIHNNTTFYYCGMCLLSFEHLLYVKKYKSKKREVCILNLTLIFPNPPIWKVRESWHKYVCSYSVGLPIMKGLI